MAWKPSVSVVPGTWPKVRIALQRDGRDAVVVIVDPAAASDAHEGSVKAWLWLFGSKTVREFNQQLDVARRMKPITDAVDDAVGGELRAEINEAVERLGLSPPPGGAPAPQVPVGTVSIAAAMARVDAALGGVKP